MIETSSLEVTFRHGRPLAAYLHLARRPGDYVARTDRVGAGLAVDYTPDDRPCGIEILDPRSLRVDILNGLLSTLGVRSVEEADVAPLRRAG